jgi:hypothetical protein
MDLGSTLPLTEMSTMNLHGGKWRPALKADNLTIICEPIVWRKCVSLDFSQLDGPSRPVGYLYLFSVVCQGMSFGAEELN